MFLGKNLIFSENTEFFLSSNPQWSRKILTVKSVFYRKIGFFPKNSDFSLMSLGKNSFFFGKNRSRKVAVTGPNVKQTIQNKSQSKSSSTMSNLQIFSKIQNRIFTEKSDFFPKIQIFSQKFRFFKNVSGKNYFF
jgi:hypothetical protein